MSPDDIGHGPAPVLVTGTARSGTTLVSHMLDAHPKAACAIDPFLPLFKAFRNAVVREAAVTAGGAFDPDGPIQDYYYRQGALAVLDAVLAADLDLPFDADGWPDLHTALKARADLESPDIVPLLDGLPGATHRDVFENAFDAVARARDAEDARWAGAKDLWTVEFLPAIARSLPEARFVAVVRDPRAVLNSHVAGVEKDPDAASPAVSYTRHWRKLAALLHRFLDDPLLDGRLHVLRYERLVEAPTEAAGDLAAFLDLDDANVMLDTDRWIDPRTGDRWTGNSSFRSEMDGVRSELAHRWRETLDGDLAALTDLVCDPEMRLLGYEPVTGDGAATGDALRGFVRDHAEHRDYAAWRTDLGDPVLDHGCELVRRALLARPDAPDGDLVRRCFLFEEVHETLLDLPTASSTVPKTTPR